VAALITAKFVVGGMKKMSEQRLYHTVANKLLELMDSGVFPPGSRLPGERELAKRFGVSRVSIREAEIALQAQGRVEIKVGSGVYVLDRSNLPVYGLPKMSIRQFVLKIIATARMSIRKFSRPYAAVTRSQRGWRCAPILRG